MLPGDAADSDGNQPETLPPPQPAPANAEPHLAEFAAWLDRELEALEQRWAPFAAPAVLRDVKLRISL